MRRKLAAALVLALLLILVGLRFASPPEDARRRAALPAAGAPPAPLETAAAFASAEPAPEEEAASAVEVPAPTPPAVPAPPPVAPDPLPVIEPLTGLRFEARFPDWRTPHVPGAAGWLVVGYRESLTGCRRISSHPLRRELGPMDYRIELHQGLGRPEATDGKISLAVFLLAVPIDARGQPIGGHLVAHSAEAHLHPHDLERDPHAFLRERARTIDFSVELEGAPPDRPVRGWFEHAAIEERWPAAELPQRLRMSFPATPEMFANEAGWLRFAGARFDAHLSPDSRLEVVGWPRGMYWPLTFAQQERRESFGIWTLVEPNSVRNAGSPSRTGFEPQPGTLHSYRRLPEIHMPPIEVEGPRRLREFLEDAVVIAETSGFDAEARPEPETGLWVWSVSRALPAESQHFRAILFVPGMTPITASGRTNSDEPLVFRLHPAEPGGIIGEELIVAPALRLDIPVAYELELELRGSPWWIDGQGLARGGVFTLGGLPRRAKARLVVEADTTAWAQLLEETYRARWGRDLSPLEVRAEAIGETSTGATVLEVTVEHDGEIWPLAAFLEEFGIPP